MTIQKARFSKGPWTVDVHNERILGQGLLGGDVARVIVAQIPLLGLSGGDSAANARLIAEAPELHDLVREARVLIACAFGAEHSAWVQRADAAISKVEASQPLGLSRATLEED